MNLDRISAYAGYSSSQDGKPNTSGYNRNNSVDNIVPSANAQVYQLENVNDIIQKSDKLPVRSITGNLLIRNENLLHSNLNIPENNQLASPKRKHDPKNLRDYLDPRNHKRRPWILEKLKQNSRDALRNPMKYGNAELHYKEGTRNKDGSYRKVRSDRRENQAMLEQAIAHHIDIKSLKIGFYNQEGRFHNFSWDYISKTTGITRDTILDIKDEYIARGYIIQKENKVRRPDGSIKSDPATIYITEKFFISLGVTALELDKKRFPEKYAALKILEKEEIESLKKKFKDRQQQRITEIKKERWLKKQSDTNSEPRCVIPFYHVSKNDPTSASRGTALSYLEQIRNNLKGKISPS